MKARHVVAMAMLLLAVIIAAGGVAYRQSYQVESVKLMVK